MGNWSLNEENEIMFKNVRFTQEEIVTELNDNEDKVRKMKDTISKNEHLIELKDQLIESYEKKIKEQEKLTKELAQSLNDKQTENMNKAQESLKDEKEEKLVQSVNYWKGVEQAYMKLLNDYLDRITALELEKWYYEIECEDLKNLLSEKCD